MRLRKANRRWRLILVYHQPHSSTNIDRYILLLCKRLQFFVIKHIHIPKKVHDGIGHLQINAQYHTYVI